MKIDLQEALTSLKMEINGITPQWFTDLDTNHDGFIETEEFDSDLNDNLVTETKGKPGFDLASLGQEKPDLEENPDPETIVVNSEEEDEE